MIFKSFVLEQDKKILNDLKCVLFYGENLGLKKEFKNLIKNLNKNSESLNYFQEEIIKNPEFFLNEVINNSLFGNEKIFFIENVNDKILDVINSLNNEYNNKKIFLFAENLDKKSKLRNCFEKSETLSIVACYPDNEITLKKLISEKLKGFEGLSPANLNLILEQTSMNRMNIMNEIEKIKIYSQNKKINESELLKIIDRKDNDNFNILKDEALNGNKKKTNKLLSDTIFENEKNVYYLNLINQRLNQLFELKKGTIDNLENSLNKLRPPIFWKDKPNFINQAKKWDKNKIKKALNKSYDIELKIKSNNSIRKDLLLKAFIIELCQVANS